MSKDEKTGAHTVSDQRTLAGGSKQAVCLMMSLKHQASNQRLRHCGDAEPTAAAAVAAAASGYGTRTLCFKRAACQPD